MIKYNNVSYCHDCGTKIEGENFYCEKCINENGLNKFNIAAFILCLIQPLFAIVLCILYKKRLNPGIYKSANWALMVYIILIALSSIFGFIYGLLGLA